MITTKCEHRLTCMIMLMDITLKSAYLTFTMFKCVIDLHLLLNFKLTRFMIEDIEVVTNLFLIIKTKKN